MDEDKCFVGIRFEYVYVCHWRE